MGESLADLCTRIRSDLQLGASVPLPPMVADRLFDLPEEAGANGWTLSDAKHRWETHAHWLFLRLCPYPDRVRRPKEIADEHVDRTREVLHDSTVRLAVTEMATALRIDLPPAPRGRPRIDIKARSARFD